MNFKVSFHSRPSLIRTTIIRTLANQNELRLINIHTRRKPFTNELIKNFVYRFPCPRIHSSKSWTDEAMSQLHFRAYSLHSMPQLHFYYFPVTPPCTPVTLLPPLLSSWRRASVTLPAIQSLPQVTIWSWQCIAVGIKFHHYCNPTPVTLANASAHTYTHPVDERAICLMA